MNYGSISGYEVDVLAPKFGHSNRGSISCGRSSLCGSELFNTKTNDTLHMLKGPQATLCSLIVYTSATKRKQRRPHSYSKQRTSHAFSFTREKQNSIKRGSVSKEKNFCISHLSILPWIYKHHFDRLVEIRTTTVLIDLDPSSTPFGNHLHFFPKLWDSLTDCWKLKIVSVH